TVSWQRRAIGYRFHCKTRRVSNHVVALASLGITSEGGRKGDKDNGQRGSCLRRIRLAALSKVPEICVVHLRADRRGIQTSILGSHGHHCGSVGSERAWPMARRFQKHC